MSRFVPSILVAIILSVPALSEGSTLTISCASSLQDVIRDLARAYEATHPETRIHVNSGGSQLLARQIEAGAPVDLFLSADEPTMKRLVASGRVDSGSVIAIAGNRVVAVVPSDRVPEVHDVDDLTASHMKRIALPDTTVPIGRYATAFLRYHGLLDKISKRTVRTENVRASLAAAVSGAVDLAFVYATDAQTTDRVRIVWNVSPESIPPVRAIGGIVESSTNPSVARKLLEYLRSREAVRAFRAAGFLPPD